MTRAKSKPPREVYVVEIQLVEYPGEPWIVLSQMDYAERDWVPDTYHTRKEAEESASGTDHPSRAVRYIPAPAPAKKRGRKPLRRGKK